MLRADEAGSTQPSATSDEITIDQVNVGFNGRFKVGRWTPVVLQVTTAHPVTIRPVIVVSDPDGNETSLPGDPVNL